MSIQCSVCGRPISENVKKCICGYDQEGWVLMELDKPDRKKTVPKAGPEDIRAAKEPIAKKTGPD